MAHSVITLNHQMAQTIDTQVFRLDQTPAVHQHHPQFRIVYGTSTGSILFRQYFQKSCETYQLTNQSLLFTKTYKIHVPISLYIA